MDTGDIHGGERLVKSSRAINMLSTSPGRIRSSSPTVVPVDAVVRVDRAGNRVGDHGDLIDSDAVPDKRGKMHSVVRGDIVRIRSKASAHFGRVGHVRGFTQKRIKVHLTDRRYGRAFDAKNLEFVALVDDPIGVAYHKRWKTGYTIDSSDDESSDAIDSSDDATSEANAEEAGAMETQPSRCILM